MDINWAEIKEEIKSDFGDLFTRQNPSYLDIDYGILLFQKVIYHNLGLYDLGGLSRTLPVALNEAYTDKIGQLGPLRIIADSLEPYLKKIALIANLDSRNNILSKQLMPLLKLLNLNSALTSQTNGGYPQFNESQFSGYVGQPEYLEYLCSAYLTRNKVHDSPDWNRRIVLEKLSHILVVYVYAALKFKDSIDLLNVSRPEATINDKIGEDQKYLYYFISFGSTTNKIRNQVVTSYILNHLHEKGELRLEEIRDSTNTFFSVEMNLGYYNSFIQKIINDQKVEYVKDTKFYRLSFEEKRRIVRVQENFQENRNIFFLFLEDILRKYNILSCINPLFDKLQEFIENNYNIDIAEAYDKGAENEKDENLAYNNFVSYLATLVNDNQTANQLFKDLIELSKDSDFLIRMCASKAFANLTNPDRFDQYIHQEIRTVYLDTQIILFALCLNYVNNVGYSNMFYQATEELIRITNKKKNIKLKVSRLYLQEVAHQLKLALLLIPFEEVGEGKLSSNVFYQFYWHLKENNILEVEDKSFADFMYNWFRLYEEDAFDTRFHKIAYENLYNFLTSTDLNIEIETLPPYDNKSEAVEVLNKVLDNANYKFRPKNSIDNDALMMCHLCNPEIHRTEPFFLTWDKVFTKFRKDYISKYKRNNIISFHLFNPAKFLNHLSLLTLKINPQAITNDFLSLMDSNNIHERTQTIWDVVNKFLNIDSINSQKRKKYIHRIKELFEQELDYSIEDFNDVEKTNKVFSPLENIISKISDHFNYTSEFNILQYRNLLLSEDYFEKVSKLIFSNVAEQSNNNDVIGELEDLIRSFNDEVNSSLVTS